jgi:hypothetical protein
LDWAVICGDIPNRGDPATPLSRTDLIGIMVHRVTHHYCVGEAVRFRGKAAPSPTVTATR